MSIPTSMLGEPEFTMIYDGNGVPFQVYSLSAFCKEQGLDLPKMQDMVRGKTKQHQGWHLDPDRTNNLVSRAREISTMFGA